jgi:hypothetical protein
MLRPSRQQVSTFSGPGPWEPFVKTVPLLAGEEAEPLVGWRAASTSIRALAVTSRLIVLTDPKREEEDDLRRKRLVREPP